MLAGADQVTAVMAVLPRAASRAVALHDAGTTFVSLLTGAAPSSRVAYGAIHGVGAPQAAAAALTSHTVGAVASSHGPGSPLLHTASGRIAHRASSTTTREGHRTTASPGRASTKVLDTGAPTVSAGHMLLQLLLGMAIIVGVVVAGAKLARGRRGVSTSGRGSRRRGALVQVLARQPLGKGVSVAVVQVGARAYLLGVSANEVRPLGETDAAELTELTRLPVISSLGTGDGPAGATASSRFRRAARGPSALAAPRQLRSVALRGVRPAGSFEDRPTPTWTSAIEHLRERTVRRA